MWEEVRDGEAIFLPPYWLAGCHKGLDHWGSWLWPFKSGFLVLTPLSGLLHCWRADPRDRENLEAMLALIL